MGEGRRPDSGGKEHLGPGGRVPRLKGGVLAAGLLLATGALAATTASSTAGASRAAGGIALSASKPPGRADAGAQAAAGKAVAGQEPQRLTGGAIPLTALKGVAVSREGLQVAAATRSATGTVSAAGLAGATQVAMLDWPRTDTGGRASISGEAMTALAVQQLLRAGIAEADFGMAIVPLKGGGASPVSPAGASWTPAAPIEHRTTEGGAGWQHAGVGVRDGRVLTEGRSWPNRPEADGALAEQASDEPMLRVMHQAERPFNPASTMKLVTTHAALSMLGPNYRWTTRFLTTGPIRDGVLQGDLILQGGGDPHLVIEDLHALMADLRAQGLTTIRGDLVVDDARFAVGPADGEAFDGDASQAYNVRPWAALTNFKASKLVIDPKKRQLALEPPLADVQLRYDVKVLKGRCRTGGTRLGVQDGATAAGRPVVSVNGTQVRACGSQQFYAAMLDHQQFLHGIFKAAWKDMGGKFTGRTRIQPGAAARGRPLYAWQSTLDLGEVVHHINKFSNNVMTRMLLLEMAAASGQGALAPDRAGQWLHQWYRGQGLALPSLVMENGSGLSRQARISAGDMVTLLARAAGSPTARWFEASLPVVGIDGTMRTRLRMDPVAGQAQIKTGTLQNVRAIAGYVTAASGRRYALSLMINGKYPAERALHAQDELLRWVYRHG